MPTNVSFEPAIDMTLEELNKIERKTSKCRVPNFSRNFTSDHTFSDISCFPVLNISVSHVITSANIAVCRLYLVRHDYTWVRHDYTWFDMTIPGQTWRTFSAFSFVRYYPFLFWKTKKKSFFISSNFQRKFQVLSRVLFLEYKTRDKQENFIRYKKWANLRFFVSSGGGRCWGLGGFVWGWGCRTTFHTCFFEGTFFCFFLQIFSIPCIEK